MQLPKFNSRGMVVLKALQRCPMTVYQGIEVHGNFVTNATPGGIDHEKIVEIYCDLIDRGCLVKEGIKYRLTLHCVDALAKLEPKPSHLDDIEIVKPPYRNPWTREMKPGSVFKNVVRRGE